jgi:polyisoprenoid-binding protein YceI
MLGRILSLPLPLALAVAVFPPPRLDPKPAVDAVKYDIDVAHSAVEFTIRFMGLTNVRGRFDDYAGTIMYHEKDPVRSSVSVIIKTTSINTGNGARDKDLRGEAFFDVAKYPNITFRSTRLEKSGDGFIAFGAFSMHGVDRDLAIPLTRMHEKVYDAWGNIRIGYTGHLMLNRKDFGITGSNFWNQAVDLRRMALGDSVSIDLSIEAEIPNFDKWTFPAQEQHLPAGDTVLKVITNQGVKPALTLFQQLRRDHASEYSAGETQLNLVGYKLLGQGKTAEAVEVFKLNAELFPQSANVYNSLAEAYVAHGDKDLAIANYARSLEMNPEDTSAAEMLRWLKA